MKSIRGQLTVSLLLCFAILLIASSAAVYCFTRLGMLHEFDAGLRAKAMTMMSLTQEDNRGIKFDLPDNFYQTPGDAGSPRYFELWQTNGVVCGRSQSLDKTDLPCRYGDQNAPEIWDLTLPDGRPGRAIGYKFSPSVEDEDKQGVTASPAILVVAADLTAINKTLLLLAVVLFATGLATLLITIAIVRVCLNRGHAPLSQLASQAATITADSLDTRFQADSMPAELKPIATRLNDLLARLQDSFERERQFTSDIAHELRTPIAELRSLAEVEIAWPDRQSPERPRETLAIALQMEAMVTRLLDLMRSENAQIQLKKESVDVAGLINEIWTSQLPKAKEKQLDFRADIPTDTTIQTDRALFRAIVTNLLSNAAEYTPAGGQIRIACKSSPFEMTFTNSVHDLTPEDLPHLFERLWRKDKSRSGGEHFGLGLALSRSYAQLLGYQISATLTADNFLSISLISARIPKNVT